MRKVERQTEQLYLYRPKENLLIVAGLSQAQRELLATVSIDFRFLGLAESLLVNEMKKEKQEIEQGFAQSLINARSRSRSRPPFNAEYLLYLLVHANEREFVIGDLIEGYDRVLHRFDKQRADIWFYKQVAGSLLPLLRQALLKIGALVWLGRILQRLVS